MRGSEYLFYLSLSFVIISSAVSCSRETVCGLQGIPVAGDSLACLNLSMNFGGHGVKSLLSEEDTDTGFQLLIFNRADGSLVDCISFGSRYGGEVILRKDTAYDLYVIGNLWYLDDSGRMKTLCDAGIVTSDGVRNLAYRFDGSTVGGGLRTERFADFAVYGIPYAGSAENVSFSSDGDLSIPAVYLFAKVNITVDHSGMVNGKVAAEVFRNSRLYVRGANGVVKPFIRGTAAASGSDLLGVSDYDASMDSASGLSSTYTYYVPENAQGTAPVTSPAGKTPDVMPLATYVEFTAVVDGADATAGGYGGTVTYQFCLGANGTTDFNVLRNTIYNVRLSFQAGSLFSPCWKIDGSDADDWSDTRRLLLSADASGNNPLKSDGTQILAVRKTRPARCYVYFNRNGESGINERTAYLDYLTSGQNSYNPENVSMSGYDIVCSESDLSQYALNLSYSHLTGELTVSYDEDSPNAGNFRKVPDEGIPLTLTLYPGGQTCKAVIRTYGEMFSDIDRSEIYVGQKIILTAEGFAGIPCLQASEGNVFRTRNTPGQGYYLGHDPIMMTSGNTELYAYRNSPSVILACSSTDPFNDGEIRLESTVYKPSLTLSEDEYDLPIDGTKVPVHALYEDRNGDVMEIQAFDSEVYGQLLKPVLSRGVQSSGDFSYVKMDAEEAMVYLYDITDQHPVTRTKLGTIKVCGADESLFPGVYGSVFYRYPKLVSGYPESIVSNIYNVASLPRVEFSAGIDAAGCTLNPFDNIDIRECYSVDSGDDWNAVCAAPDQSGHQDVPYISYSDGVVTWGWHPDLEHIWSNGTIDAPYGKRSLTVKYTNVNSGSGKTYPVTPLSFTISYNTVSMVNYCVFHLGTQSEAWCFVCSRLSAFLSQKKSEVSGRIVEPAGIGRMTMPIYGYQYNMNNYSMSGQGDMVGWKSSLDSRFLLWSLENNDNPFTTTSPWDEEYKDSVWDSDLVDEVRRYHYGLPHGVGFYYGGTFQSYLDVSSYPYSSEEKKRTMQTLIPVRVENNPAPVIFAY